MVEPLLASAVAEVKRIPDPGAREAAAGALLPDALLEDPGELLSEAMDIVAGARDGPELLAGMAVAGPTPVAIRARLLLEERGDPSAGLGSPRVEQAWEMDANEPVVALYLLCSRKGASGKQLFSFVVETPVSGGAVKDGFVTGTSEGTRVARKLTSALPEDVPVQAIDPADAVERVVAAAVQGARMGLAPTADGLQALAVFLRTSGVEDADAIVQALELGDSLPDRVAELEDEAGAAAVSALAAEAEEWLTGEGFDRERVEAAAFATGLMGDFRAFYLAAELTDWQADELQEFLLDWVPRKVSLADEEIDGFPSAVADAFRFLGATGRLAEREAAALAERALLHAAEFDEAMADPAKAGPARLVFDAMSADGVEVGDPDAMQAWLEEFNARPFEERDRILGPALEPRAPTRPAKTKRRKAQKQARRRNRGR